VSPPQSGGLAPRDLLWPAAVAVLLLALWQALVLGFELPPYLVPGPWRVAQVLVDLSGWLDGMSVASRDFT
jgi:ABC-type nitrate/sulfonate/bicarbonate transport system permease component